MTRIKQYEMKFFLNISKNLTKASILPISYTWELTIKIQGKEPDIGETYHCINEEINCLKDSFEKAERIFTIEGVAEELFERLMGILPDKGLVLTYLKVSRSPMVGYEIVRGN